MPTPKPIVFALLTAFALATGCTDGDARGPNVVVSPPDGTRTDPPPPVSPDPLPPPVARYAGVYALSAPLDFTQSGVLPGAVGTALGALAELHDHPGDALLDVIKIANIPYLSDLLNQVPGFLQNALAALLDELIVDQLYDGHPVVDQVAAILQGLFELSQQLAVEDQLTLHAPDAQGNVAIEQQLTGVTFALAGKSQTVPFAGTSRSMAGTLTPHANAPVADADLTVGAGSFSLPVGPLLLQAAGPLLFAQFGGAQDLKGALLHLVPCADFGQSLSDGLGGYLSASDAESLCQGALAGIAQLATSAIEALSFDGIVVDGGKGQLLDARSAVQAPDYQADRLAQGTWTWTFTLASQSVSVPSSFAGDRIGAK